MGGGGGDGGRMLKYFLVRKRCTFQNNLDSRHVNYFGTKFLTCSHFVVRRDSTRCQVWLAPSGKL